MIEDQSPAALRQRMKENETFVVNVVAAWCPDCTERQEPNFPEFVRKMEEAGVPVYQCRVQEERLVFISAEHESLTSDFGGHGYPRTVLVAGGKMMDSRVEVMDGLALSMLADTFLGELQAG